MSSAERQRLHRANLSDVQRVNDSNRNNASRILARAEVSEEVIEDIRVANSASRIIARAEVSEEVIEDIRVANSASRIIALYSLTDSWLLVPLFREAMGYPRDLYGTVI